MSSGGLKRDPDHVTRRIHELPERLSDLVWRGERDWPGDLAVIDGEVRWTYAELAEAVRSAMALLRDHGLRAGDRVMLVNENGRAIIALALAVAALDLWAIVVNGRLSAAEIAAIAAHSGARRQVFTAGASPDAEAHGRAVGATAISHPLLGGLAMGPLNTQAESEPVEASGAGQVALLVYTSGTTGHPKAVMLTHRNLLFIAAISGGLRGFRRGDVVYGILPLAHVFGFASVFLGGLYAGSCYMPRARFTAEQLAADIASGITHLQGVPAMFAKFLAHLRQTGTVLGPHRIRFTSAGGAPLDLALKKACEAIFGQPLHNGYGTTEASPSMAMTRVEAPRADGSVGQALPFVELIAVDDEGRRLPDGETGHIWCRGPGVMKGYYREPELTARAITADGWLITGDMGYFDGDGSLHVVGRSKELIIRSGFNVYPPEVEGVLSEHRGVVLAAVIGVSAGGGEEEVVAYVQVMASNPPSTEELSRHCAHRLAPYKRPSRFVLCEHLPVTPAGKVIKRNLLAEAVPLNAPARRGPG